MRKKVFQEVVMATALAPVDGSGAEPVLTESRHRSTKGGSASGHVGIAHVVANRRLDPLVKRGYGKKGASIVRHPEVWPNTGITSQGPAPRENVMRTGRHVVLFLAFTITLAAQARAVESAGYLDRAGFQMTSVAQLAYEPLASALQEIQTSTNLRPRIDEADLSPKVATDGPVMITELTDLDHPWETTFFFYRRDDGQAYFLRIRSTMEAPEARLWSEGPSEIVLSRRGTRWQPEASLDTFRFGHNQTSIAPRLSVSDAIGCVAKILGLTPWDWTSAVTLFTSITCNATTQFEVAEVLLACASVFSFGTADVTATAGCIGGVGKLISCGILSCSTVPPVPSGVTASDGGYTDRVHITWNQASGASYYVLYRSLTPTSGGSTLGSTQSTSYDDYSAVTSALYYYSVQACSSAGCSAISGYDSGWRASSSSGCSGTSYTAYLNVGGTSYQPNGSYYYSSVWGLHQGHLTGPAGTDFDLYLQQWNGNWYDVAASAGTTSTESISFNGPPNYYMWRVHAWSGSGWYTLCINHP